MCGFDAFVGEVECNVLLLCHLDPPPKRFLIRNRHCFFPVTNKRIYDISLVVFIIYQGVTDINIILLSGVQPNDVIFVHIAK